MTYAVTQYEVKAKVCSTFWSRFCCPVVTVTVFYFTGKEPESIIPVLEISYCGAAGDYICIQLLLIDAAETQV